VLTFHSSDISVGREYKVNTFKDTWKCHEYIAENKMELLTPHILTYGEELKGFEFYCESRYGEEV
tara:strand:- start:125 stop:319 length:195 start_codon:yes stop_codon:yes gene_type:complete